MLYLEQYGVSMIQNYHSQCGEIFQKITFFLSFSFFFIYDFLFLRDGCWAMHAAMICQSNSKSYYYLILYYIIHHLLY